MPKKGWMCLTNVKWALNKSMSIKKKHPTHRPITKAPASAYAWDSQRWTDDPSISNAKFKIPDVAQSTFVLQKKCSVLLHLVLGSPQRRDLKEAASVKILSWSLWFQNYCGLVMFHKKVLTLYLTVTVIKSIYCIICYSFVFITQLFLLIKCSFNFSSTWITLFKGQASGMKCLLKHYTNQSWWWVENYYVH